MNLYRDDRCKKCKKERGRHKAETFECNYGTVRHPLWVKNCFFELNDRARVLREKVTRMSNLELLRVLLDKEEEMDLKFEGELYRELGTRLRKCGFIESEIWGGP